MTKKKPKKKITVIETHVGKLDLNEYFKVLIMERIDRDCNR